MKHTLFRILAALALLIGVVLSMVRSAQAAASPTIEVIAVKVGETVTIRAYDFPGGLFTVRMDKYGNMALNGLVADVTNTGAGGSFQETYKIPAALKNEARLAIRLENSAGYYAYDWFANQISTQPTPTPTVTPVPVTNKATISVLSVEQNKTVTLRTTNFPANTNFTVRVGPFYTFFRDYVTTGTINSGKGGTFDFSVTLPAVVKDVELVTVRLDGGGIYAYNALRNVSGSGVLTPAPTTSPTATPTPTNSASACQITSIVLNGLVTPGSDFDAAPRCIRRHLMTGGARSKRVSPPASSST